MINFNDLCESIEEYVFENNTPPMFVKAMDKMAHENASARLSYAVLFSTIVYLETNRTSKDFSDDFVVSFALGSQMFLRTAIDSQKHLRTFEDWAFFKNKKRFYHGNCAYEDVIRACEAKKDLKINEEFIEILYKFISYRSIIFAIIFTGFMQICSPKEAYEESVKIIDDKSKISKLVSSILRL